LTLKPADYWLSVGNGTCFFVENDRLAMQT
jgi:hypothetical protein